MIFIGILTAFLGIAIVLLSRSVTTFFHEMGHAIPALFFTKGQVEVYIGSYGDISKSLKVNIGRLTIYFKFNFFDWNIGLCRYKSTGYLITELITILGGPLMSIIISIFLILFMAKNGATENMAFLFGVFIMSAIWDFLVNIYPNKSPYQLHDGAFIYSDGYQIKRLLRQINFPDEYYQALEKYNSGEYKMAAEGLENILKNDFKKREIYRLLCDSLEKAKDYDKAEKYFEEYYNRFKLQTEDYANLGLLFLKKGKHQKALDCLGKALHKDYKNARMVNAKGLVLLEMGHVELAIQEFTSAIYYEPKLAEAYRNRGFAKLKNRQTEDAYLDLKTALGMGPPSPYNHFYLGKYFEKKWRFAEALEQYEKAKEMGIDHHGIDFEIEEVKKRTK